MSALFSAIVAKAAVFICSFLLVTSGPVDNMARKPHMPFRVMTAAQEKESADTTKTIKPAKPAPEAEPEREAEAVPTRKPREEKKSIKISISDEGIKIGARNGEETVIFEFDSQEMGRALEDLEQDLELLRDLPESVAVMLLEDDDRAYVKVRGSDVVRFGKDIHIGRHELVQGDVVCIAGDIIIEGKVRGNVVNVFGETVLYGTAVINGDVVTVMGELNEYNNPRVRGETVNVASGAPNIHLPFLSYGTGNMWDVIVKVIKFIIFTLLLLMIIYFLPDRMKMSSDHVFGSFFRSLGVGILVLLVLSYGALLLLGYFVSALALGRLLCQKFGPNGASPFLSGFMGLFLITLPGLMAAMMWVMPFLMPIQILLKTLAVFLGFLAAALGSGALIISKAGVLPLEQRPEVPKLPDAPAVPAEDAPAVPVEPEEPEWPGPAEE
jgi:hypothetical protein